MQEAGRVRAASAFGLRFCAIERGFHLPYRGANMRNRSNRRQSGNAWRRFVLRDVLWLHQEELLGRPKGSGASLKEARIWKRMKTLNSLPATWTARCLTSARRFPLKHSTLFARSMPRVSASSRRRAVVTIRCARFSSPWPIAWISLRAMARRYSCAESSSIAKCSLTLHCAACMRLWKSSTTFTWWCMTARTAICSTTPHATMRNSTKICPTRWCCAICRRLTRRL